MPFGRRTMRPVIRPASMSVCASPASSSASERVTTALTWPRFISPSTSSSWLREVLVTESIDWFLRKSCAGLNGTNWPVSCPIRIQRPETPRLRRIGSKSGVPTLSTRTSTPRPSVSRFTWGEKSSPRACTTTSCAPISRMRSALSGEVVCAMTYAPASRASCTACSPSPPPAPVTSALSPIWSLPTSRTPLRMVPIAHEAIEASASGTPSGTAATLSSPTATYSP